jgi:hypothetical protein
MDLWKRKSTEQVLVLGIWNGDHRTAQPTMCWAWDGSRLYLVGTALETLMAALLPWYAFVRSRLDFQSRQGLLPVGEEHQTQAMQQFVARVIPYQIHIRPGPSEGRIAERLPTSGRLPNPAPWLMPSCSLGTDVEGPDCNVTPEI